MEKQKFIPPVSKKITRKLAQESDDHKSLMNYYSSISRDETGAPKRWKMSSPLRIDEDLIASARFSSGKSSPGSSRESSGERRGRQSLADTSRNTTSRRTGSRDSSEGGSSRDSSLETKGKNKSDKGDKSEKLKNTSQLNGGTKVNSVTKKKRGRPKSLDLSSSKTVLNGDDDNFKSPDPLTPCNVVVKRRKGRPKETPPTLVAETPMEDVTNFDEIESEKELVKTKQESEQTSKRKGRPPKQLKGKVVNKTVAVKKAGGRGRFNLKSNLNRTGFRKLPKLTKMKPSVISFEPGLTNHVNAGGETVEGVADKKNGAEVVKRKPGRPPGAKNKPKPHMNLKYLNSKRGCSNKINNTSERGRLSLKSKMGKPGRRPGRKPQTMKSQNLVSASAISGSSNAASFETDLVGKTVDQGEDMFLAVHSDSEPVANCDGTHENLDGSMDTSVVTHGSSTNAVVESTASKNLDDAINAVVYKAGNDLPLYPESKRGKKVASNYRHGGGVVSIAKLRKMKMAIKKVRKKIVCLPQHRHLDGRTVDVLAPNDLRRKLHEKVLKKMHLNNIATFPNCKTNEDLKTEKENSDVIKKESPVFKTEMFYSAQVDTKSVSVSSSEVQNKMLARCRKLSADLGDMKKFSDTDSICSELSTNSLCSSKRQPEKQIIVLGEENNDSDDSSIRTRQRFDIIPGKKRKRTLSGEFDLLDEKQLRKERKQAKHKATTNDENVFHTVEKTCKTNKQSPKRRSPKVNIRNKSLIEKYGTTFKARKVQLLKQSPFLTYKKRRKKGFRRNLKNVSPLRSPKTKFEQKEISFIKTAGNTLEPGMTNASVLGNVSSSEVQRKSLFEQFTDVTLKSSDSKCSSLETDYNSVEHSVSDRHETEAEVVVKGLLSEIIEMVVPESEQIPDTFVPEILESKLDVSLNGTSVNDSFGNSTSFASGHMNLPNSPGISLALEPGKKHKLWRKGRPGKVRKRKFGPLPIARKQACFDAGKLPRGRKKLLTQKDRKIKSTARKTTQESKSSPDVLVTRKFELRQKISRSPLDNIALKQSLEETKYLKAEQLRASRKEGKLKSKLKAANQDSMESFPSDISEVTSEQYVETQAEELVTDVHIPKHFSLEEMKKKCKPCSVVLVDFIEKLKIQSSQDTDISENETSLDESVDNSTEDNNNESFSSPEKIKVINTELVPNEESNSQSMKNKSIEDKNSLENKDIVGVAEITEDVCTDSVENKSEFTMSEIDIVKAEKDLIGSETVSMKPRSLESNNKQSDTEFSVGLAKVENKEGIKSAKITAKITTLKSSVKVKKTENKRINQKRTSRKSIVSEQQTARKTVPPLKIKVKGVKRKTYMVEPHPDSPIENTSDSKLKTERKKRSKSGNKSESSDTEKHSKGHHHHKKRNKSPNDDSKSKSENTTKESPNKAIKATDAYEANFLQFIQEKDKVEHNIQTFSASMSPKNKGGKTPTQSKIMSSEVNNSVPMTSSDMAHVSLNNQTLDNSVAQPVGTLGSEAKEEDGDVRYVCSQCDNVEYKSEELILQHYRDVHPGAQVMYKPLQETPAENERIHLGPKPCPVATVELQNMTKTCGGTEPTDNVDDDDNGSLNLKIVDVVSLKDQNNVMDMNIAQQTKPILPVQTLQSGQIKVNPMLGPELRIPHYPVPASLSNVSPVNPNAELYKHLLKNVARPQMPLGIPQTRKPASTLGKVANTFKCDKCNVHAPHLAAMVAHLRNSHKEIQRLFQCPYCKDLEAESEALIHQHIKKNHPTDNPNPPVALSEPAKRNLKTLAVHLPDTYKLGESNMLEKDIYMCLICKVHMPSLDTIYDHLEQNHSEVFVFVCPYCKEYKSKTEEGVCAHILHVHRTSSADVSISIAIDGTRFTRVQCLMKDKPKKHSPGQQKQAAGISGSQHTPQIGTHVATSQANHMGVLKQPVFQSAGFVPTPSQNYIQTLGGLTQQTQKQALETHHTIPRTQHHVAQPQPFTSSYTVTSVQQPLTTLSQPPSKPTPPPGPKKKKNLLESIEHLKVQKQLEQQGLLPTKSSASSTSAAGKAVSGAPPPLMRAPPPLIRYDQLNKVSGNSTVLSTTVRMSTATTAHNVPTSVANNTLSTLQRLQSLSAAVPVHQVNAKPPRPIQSSLFDTSDMETMKPSQRPVLNVPVVPRATASPSTQPCNVTSPRPGDAAATGVLDLSAKSTPSSSPAPQKTPSPKQNPLPVTKDSFNPDVFKVFNLRPSTQMQLARPTNAVMTPGPAVLAQPILVPQQVRHNTPSTLAYRPQGPQMVSTSQIPQFINMPVGTVIGSVVVSLGNVPAGVQNLQGIPTQLVRMGGTAVPASGLVSATTTSQAVPVINTSQACQSAPLVNINVPMFRCPYCPSVVPLNLAQVKPHIESQHPGSSILFLPMENQQPGT